MVERRLRRARVTHTGKCASDVACSFFLLPSAHRRFRLWEGGARRLEVKLKREAEDLVKVPLKRNIRRVSFGELANDPVHRYGQMHASFIHLAFFKCIYFVVRQLIQLPQVVSQPF